MGCQPISENCCSSNDVLMKSNCYQQLTLTEKQLSINIRSMCGTTEELDLESSCKSRKYQKKITQLKQPLSGFLNNFQSKSALKLHAKVRRGLKTHQCKHPGCGKMFADKSNLKVHMRIHSGEKPFKCSFGCGKSFSNLTNYKDHLRRHNKERQVNLDQRPDYFRVYHFNQLWLIMYYLFQAIQL